MARFTWICTQCGRVHEPDAVEYLCPHCAPPLAELPAHLAAGLPGVLAAEYAREAARGFPRGDAGEGSSRGEGAPGLAPGSRPSALARYLDLLPIDDADCLPPLPLGPTPLLAPARLRRDLDLPRLFLKDDTALPTGSHKDRASALVVARARMRGESLIATASTGNAATSLAGMCAAAGLQALILVPASAPREKLAQMLHYGARVCAVEGTYDEAFALCLRASARFGWYNRSTAFNPYTIEGKKTVAFEIWEQLGRQAPAIVVVPVGDGAILAGVEKGFADLRRSGRIAREPRLIAVQAEGSAAIARAWAQGAAEAAPVEATTVADSIRVGAPANGRWALAALKRTAGWAVTVSDEEILSAMRRLAGWTGVYAEPAAAAALAGLVRLLGDAQRREELRRAESIVLLVTGSGLKDAAAAMRAVEPPETILPTLPALERYLQAMR